MNSTDLHYHEYLEPSRALDLERWRGVLALWVLSGTITVELIDGLRTDDSFQNRNVEDGTAGIIFGQGRLRLFTGTNGAEIPALGTSDASLIDALRPDIPLLYELCMDITECNKLKRLSSRARAEYALHQLALRHERLSLLAELCALAIDDVNAAVPKGTGYVERAIEQFKTNIESTGRLPDLA